MRIYRIDTEYINELIGRIDTQHNTINDVLNSLRAINTELETAWEADAQVTFEATYGSWIQQLDNYSQTLANVKAYLQSVINNYIALDEAAQQAAAGAAMAP
jgi:WXG100 family type VII secretion target